MRHRCVFCQSTIISENSPTSRVVRRSKPGIMCRSVSSVMMKT